jgi:hypothetical protein
MIDKQDRQLIMNMIGETIDKLVQDLYSDTMDGVSIVQEPEITSRVCQRVEDRLDGRPVGNYIVRVIAQSMPDRGPRSLERITGADLYLSVSLDGPNGFDKGLFVQAKYGRNTHRDELLDACQRMEQTIGTKSAYVWIYEPDGVKVLSPSQVRRMRGNSFKGLHRRSIRGLTGRILDCFAGNRMWGIPMAENRRQIVRERLLRVRATSALDLAFKHQ